MRKKKEVLEENVSGVTAETVAKEAVISRENFSEYDHKKIDKDIKYRAPLSYRYLRVIGWIGMAIMFISLSLTLAFKIRYMDGTIDPNRMARQEIVTNILSYISALPLPLFLIANFAVILQQRGNYRKLIKYYGKLLLIVYIGFIIIYYHYVVIFLMRLGEMSFIDARETSIAIFSALGKQNGLVVNVFIDLFCCVLIMLFIEYTPKKRFQGKKIILFRLLVLIPILYEIGSAVLMGLLGIHSVSWAFTFSLPPEILPLLGKKPLGMIAGFVIICIYIKMREKKYLKRGGTEEGYYYYLRTNRNSFNFSLIMSLVFLVVAIVDILCVVIPGVVVYKNNPDPYYLESFLEVLSSFTIGRSACLILVIPFVLLFSYTKQHANPKPDKLLPIAGVGLVVFATIETLFFALLF